MALCVVYELIVEFCGVREGIYFFYKGESGIRCAQESRGLGDVYRGQVLWWWCVVFVMVVVVLAVVGVVVVAVVVVVVVCCGGGVLWW